MSEVNHTTTGVELCFEAELTELPGWRGELVEFAHAPIAQKPHPTAQDKAVEQNMLLGM